MAELETRIESLAQELQDLILDFTLIGGIESARSGDAVHVERGTYKPPWQLSVNRRSRKEVSASYYSSNIFQLPDAFEEMQLVIQMTIISWLKALSGEHQASLREIRIGRSIRSAQVSFTEAEVPPHRRNLPFTMAKFRVLECDLGMEGIADLPEGVMRLPVVVERGPQSLVEVWLNGEEVAAEGKR
ncbi:hypothetical protein Slin14017_G063040 [Septoria linicola]|nr:hypothetical protein Slin14017_G063040 [Septoria linicola]